MPASGDTLGNWLVRQVPSAATPRAAVGDYRDCLPGSSPESCSVPLGRSVDEVDVYAAFFGGPKGTRLTGSVTAVNNTALGGVEDKRPCANPAPGGTANCGGHSGSTAFYTGEIGVFHAAETGGYSERGVLSSWQNCTADNLDWTYCLAVIEGDSDQAGHQVQANFVRQYRLTLRTEGKGKGTVDARPMTEFSVRNDRLSGECQVSPVSSGCRGYIDADVNVQVNATAKPGSYFDGWTGTWGDRQEVPFEFRMDRGNGILTARFRGPRLTIKTHGWVDPIGINHPLGARVRVSERDQPAGETVMDVGPNAEQTAELNAGHNYRVTASPFPVTWGGACAGTITGICVLDNTGGGDLTVEVRWVR